jgi:hypothetical protein
MSLDAVVFSIASIERCARNVYGAEWFEDFQVPSDGSWGVITTVRDNIAFVLDADARSGTAQVLVDLRDSGYFSRLKLDGRKVALQRMHRIAVQSVRGQKSYPAKWRQYSADRLLTVFAYPAEIGSERLVVRIELSSPASLLFCAVVTEDDRFLLEHFTPDVSLIPRVAKEYQSAATEAVTELLKVAQPTVAGVYDLDEVGYGAVTRGLTFQQWLPKLSEQQLRFVEEEPTRALKLRGPAGTGKTLAMEMKVLREAKRAVDAHRAVRILYVTHSWGVAEQVQTALDYIDDMGVAECVDVFPLISLAQMALDQGGEVRVLGDDSFTGKEAQLRTLSKLVGEAVRGDWNAFESSVSPGFRERVVAAPGTPEANRFLWDLMLEFACVISANGIMPGLNAKERYKQLERRPWMMPLTNDAEKEFVFLIYSRLVTELVGRDEMTTDQAISDYLNMLSTFRWHAERRRHGYDMIFVDEFHLFNEQERMVFHHLTKDPDKPPLIFMAMDPRQSPFETYAEFAAPGAGLAESGEAERSLGAFGSIDLEIVYRYSPEILSFLQFVDRHYPALDLGADWGISVANAKTDRESGVLPLMRLCSSLSTERDDAILQAFQLAAEGLKVALLCLDTQAFQEYRSVVEEKHSGRFQSIESRDDVESIRYTKRAIVLSQPHYVAGLQFDAVVIAGIRPTFNQYDAFQSYGLRRFLSDLYLGASRARDRLYLVGSGHQAEFPSVLKSAIDAGTLAFDDDCI